MATPNDAVVENLELGRFEDFVVGFDRPLFQSLVPLGGVDAANEASADAFAYAWQHWDRIQVMDNPQGYVYSVARNALRRRHGGDDVSGGAPPESSELPDFEPGLLEALASLSDMQRSVVYLIDGCGWGLTEAGRMLDISISTVRNHRARGLARLRNLLEVDEDD